MRYLVPIVTFGAGLALGAWGALKLAAMAIADGKLDEVVAKARLKRVQDRVR